MSCNRTDFAIDVWEGRSYYEPSKFFLGWGLLNTYDRRFGGKERELMRPINYWSRAPRLHMVAVMLVALWLTVGVQAAYNSGGYRGPDRNGIFPAQNLLKQWPEGGPKLLWSAQVGDGYSGVCVADGLVYCCALKGKDGVARAFD
ncbi:MAG: PQQ-binding-like beta-propeller repeat protein, partial [bacterium]